MVKELLMDSLSSLEDIATEGRKKDNSELVKTVKLLDSQTRQLEKEFTTKSFEPKQTLNQLFGNKLAAEERKMLDLSSNHPPVWLPLAISWLLQSFTERVRRDLGANIRKIRFSSGIQFAISFSTLGSCIEYSNLLERMTQAGFVVCDRSKKNHPILGSKVLPYHENAKALEKYFTFLGASDLTMEVKTDCIWRISGVIATERYPIEICVQEPEGKSDSSTITWNDARQISEIIKKYQFALRYHSVVMDKNLVYWLLLQYMAKIEFLLDMCDMPSFKMLKEACGSTRNEIQTTALYQAESGKFLFETERTDLSSYLSKISVRIDEICFPLGLCSHDTTMGTYGDLSFTLATYPFCLKGETILDGVWDDKNSVLRINASVDNLTLIQQHIQKRLPYAEIKEVISDINGIIKEVQVETNMPSDILYLT